MAYEVQTVTLKGTELLAAASAADRLILAGCAATQTFISQEDAINVSAVPESPYSTTTKVNVEGSENNHLFIYALFVAGESTGGDCKSLYIYGHKESDPTHDYVLAVLSSNTPFHLPIVGEVSNTYGTSLDLVYSVADGAVSSIDSSAFVTRAEFNRLYERAVTTHAYATPTVGEAQDVYGLKTFKNKVSIDYDSGANPNAYISMTRDNYSSELSGYSYQLNPTYGPSFNAVRGGLSFGTDDHKFETYVNETTNGSEITNAYRLLDEYGKNARTISNITAGAEYAYENGVRYQYGEASIEASESTGTNDAVILVRATKDVSEIIVNSDSMDFGVPVVNGSADGFEFNINFTHGSSFIKINDPVLPSSEYDQGVGLHVINSSGDNNYADIQSFVDSASCISRTGIYGKFGSYYSTIEANSFEDEAAVVLISSYNTNDGPYFSRITLDQGSIKLACNPYNNRSKTGYLTFRCFDQSSTFSLVPACDPGYKVDLGTSTNKFGTVYAETYAGTVEQASKDALGNTIASTYIKNIYPEPIGSDGDINFSKGDNTNSVFSIKAPVTDVLRQSDDHNSIGTLRLAIYKPKMSSWYNVGDWYFPAGSIYDSEDNLTPISLHGLGTLEELSFGLSLYRDASGQSPKYFYAFNDQYQDGDSYQTAGGETVTYPRELKGRWVILNSLYTHHSRSVSTDVEITYFIVLVIKIGEAPTTEN